MSDKLVTATLWLSVPFNFTAAYALLIPQSALGQLMALPLNVPVLYKVLLAFFVFAFGLVYAWLAASWEINRPVLAISAMAKISVFLIVFSLWLGSEVAFPGLAVATGDLLFGVIWGSWLLRDRQSESIP